MKTNGFKNISPETKKRIKEWNEKKKAEMKLKK